MGFIAAFTVATIVPSIYLALTDPADLRRRMHGSPRAEARTVQKCIIIAAFLGLFAMMALSAVDHRFGWSPVPAAVSLLGDVLVVIGIWMASSKCTIGWCPTFGSGVQQAVIATVPHSG